jgi:serine/threonine-protein kinase
MQLDDPRDACVNCSLATAKGPRDAMAGRIIEACDAAGVAMRVRIERTLAEGGVGVVYAGHVVHEDADDELDGPASGMRPRSGFAAVEPGRPVAVKVLARWLARDAGAVARFEREIAHALRVSHPNVVATLGAGRLLDGRPLLVMDRLEGMTLGALVRAEGPLGIARGLRLGAQILAGLEAVHAAGLVHRDLSPDNVFVVREADGGERAVILDLGFAHAPGVDSGDGVTADSPGSLVGTLSFMAPEQATRARAITARSDLFVAGLLVYYALSGRIPFRGQDDRDVLVSVVRAAPIPLRRVRRDAPSALDAVLARALAKHPDARFSGAGEMRAALGRIDAPERVIAPLAARRSAPPPALGSAAA